ncbi:conserved hypothetical protein [Treponema primitia ZAS-2]|uniref:Uncharacterized protein n=1 Tax=Treponema primitia (strain ATCC BAA-887 / DSM 12427 / ZAS-2) TaxID=545694 RepID=F5YRC0_TREPZ|nr:DUF2786 domain-containing protein [Treponema primitia]AEF85227.1 conserved hypothetical protein [Treponema primitia ZAS-2]
MSDSSEKEKVIEKIRKLFAMSESTSINEAAIAAEKAQLLMSEYSISAGDFMASFNIPTKRNIPLWQQSLGLTIADLYGVVMRRDQNLIYEDDASGYYTYSLQFIGDEVYATVAKEMFVYLKEAIQRLSMAVGGRSSRDAFCKGASRTVIEKLNNMGTDESWISQRKRRYLQACDYVENTLALVVPARRNVKFSIDQSNYDKGRDAGNRISLHRQAGGIAPQGKITGR